MILIALGANLPSRFGGPEQTLEEAKLDLGRRGVAVIRSSQMWLTEPVPASDQPWYTNAVILVETMLAPHDLLKLLQSVERDFGRTEPLQNAPRVLDLDLLAYNDLVMAEKQLIIPHTRMHKRAFVLIPLHEVAPEWQHPVSGRTVSSMLSELPPGQVLRPLHEAA